jgi:tripeptide aminopeptidase
MNNRLINTFLEIVQIDSPTGQEDYMAQWCTDEFKKLGLDVSSDDFGNVIAKLESSHSQVEEDEGDLGTTPLLLTAHLDTVEPGCGVKPVIKDGVIKSDGKTVLGADNKAAVAAIVETVRRLRENEIEHPALEIVFTRSEEVGNYGAVNLDYSTLHSHSGYSFDSSKPLGNIIIASPFYNRFDIEILGKAAHASEPDDAVNALLVMKSALNNISIGRIDENSICNIGVVEGGFVRNSIIGQIQLKGEVRSLLEDDIKTQSEKIVETFKKAGSKYGAELEIDVVRENPGFKFDEDHPQILIAQEVLSELGYNVDKEVVWGCYDANIFQGHGIDVINLSYGSSGAHTVEEQMKVEDLMGLGEIVFNLVNKVRT